MNLEFLNLLKIFLRNGRFKNAHHFHTFCPYREVGVLQVLGAADGHLQPTVEHLEPEK